MEYIGKKGGWISLPIKPGRCEAATIFPLSKMIENLKIKSLSKKRRLTDLMKNASGNLLGSTVYFGKSLGPL